MSYLLADVEVTALPGEIVVPRDCDGIGILLRESDKPIRFELRPVAGGTRITRDGIAAWMTARMPSGAFDAEIAGRDLRPLPDLTVAVCTHNRPGDLTQCLESLRTMLASANEFAARVELLVIDNAPVNDSTRTVVQRFPEIRYACEPRPGLDFARNRAIREASGALLAFIDDDAVVDRYWLTGLREGWNSYPNPGALVGPILPYELATEAQILFEKRGGFGHRFERVFYGASPLSRRIYPLRGRLGSGCNMVFRRDVLIALGGFDEALDTGAPLPGGGDLDMLHRVVRSGYVVVHEPGMVIHHKHRRDYAAFRHQMFTWDLGYMAYLVKTSRASFSEFVLAASLIARWFLRKAAKLALLTLRRDRTGLDLAAAEVRGGLKGLLGEYGRSRRRSEAIRRSYPAQQHSQA